MPSSIATLSGSYRWTHRAHQRSASPVDVYMPVGSSVPVTSCHALLGICYQWPSNLASSGPLTLSTAACKSDGVWLVPRQGRRGRPIRPGCRFRPRGRSQLQGPPSPALRLVHGHSTVMFASVDKAKAGFPPDGPHLAGPHRYAGTSLSAVKVGFASVIGIVIAIVIGKSRAVCPILRTSRSWADFLEPSARRLR